MKKLMILTSLCFLAPLASANDEQGFFIGVGAAATINDDCGSWCDSTGRVIEAGYNFNNIVGIDAKYAKTKLEEDSDIRSEISYLGVNLGHTFNSSWVRLYGKAGVYQAKEEDLYYEESVSDSNIALGVGVSFYPIQHQSSLYLKVETLVSEFEGDDVAFSQFTVGYQF